MKKLLNIIKTRIKLWRYEKYILKKLSFHEAGHLVFSYLFNIPCGYILIDYSKVNGVQLVNDNLIVEYESNSQVENLLPQQMESILNNSRPGINVVAGNHALSIDECWNIVKQYLIILLAGYESQNKFSAEFYNISLEAFQQVFSQNLTRLNPNEDTNRMRILLNNLTTDNNIKVQLENQTVNTITHYLQQQEVIAAIKAISKKVLKNKRVDRVEIEKTLNYIGFINYANNERASLLNQL